MINQNDVMIYNGMYGLYAKVGDIKINLKDIKELDVNIEFIKKQISNKTKTKNFKDTINEYSVLSGKFGPYILVTNLHTKKKFTKSIPENYDPSEITLDNIIKIVSNKTMSKKKLA